ncbi:MAG: 16S rRNA (uracil(1498)-N(3))-methyltransferase [Burkholderiales bacterium]
MPRFFSPLPLSAGASCELAAGAARHVQVLRLQPGAAITLFDGRGGEWAATIERMGRSEVVVSVGAYDAVERETARAIHLAVGVPANERMDWLVEKATELGAASIQPLITERSVLRLAGERADKKRAHWQAIATAACEQCGRNRVPDVRPMTPLAVWLAASERPAARGLLLSLRGDGAPVSEAARAGAALCVLSGPEGGISAAEEDAALAAGFAPFSLGLRVLRAETAPLAALAALTL